MIEKMIRNVKRMIINEKIDRKMIRDERNEKPNQKKEKTGQLKS